MEALAPPAVPPDDRARSLRGVHEESPETLTTAAEVDTVLDEIGQLREHFRLMNEDEAPASETLGQIQMAAQDDNGGDVGHSVTTTIEQKVSESAADGAPQQENEADGSPNGS